ncbi:hypothetical protein J4E85_006912 [Alternaria conjuncta]|uniref:uncharacterized protein n=1 Tax=Alternaria conjuncta TaxID=181017 RepID=UPI00221F3121|nr:uncharacterized protein J4E85_006912 [Alternaria conjuncta]KAI4926618.1 hypothetical protein J4E85_006912 [Alternaria conjuncta]
MFQRRTANTKDCWGYRFEWTPEHLTPEQMKPMKFSYDVLAEECLDRLNAISPPHKGALPRNDSNRAALSSVPGTEEEKKEPLPVPKRDLYALLEENHNSDPKLAELWREVHTVPDWVDWEQIARGQDVFYRYGGPALTGLTFQSLLGGMGAARVVETLARTGGFSTKVARGRLFETTQHILQCTRTLDGLKPGGEGFASSIRVRFLHAAVRQRIMKLAKERPSYFNVEEWGIPINDLDQIATIGTFSSTLIYLSFPRQGIFLRKQEIDDYLALWRYIGYLMGTPDEWLSTPTKAKAIMESLLYHEVDPSEMSKTMANNIIYALKEEPPTFSSADMLTASARWLNGNALCDRLGLKRVSAYYWSLMAGQCLFFIFYCYTYSLFPNADRRRIDRAKEIFWTLIVKAKWGLAGTETSFDFKYVPQYDTLTHLGNIGERKKVALSNEMRNLKALGIGVGVLAVGTLVAVKIACPRNPEQDGVCGCPSFWRYLKASAAPNNKTMSSPPTKSSSPILVIIESERDEDKDLHHRKRQKREDSVITQTGVIGLSASESQAYMASKYVAGESDRKIQHVMEAARRAQKSRRAEKEKAKPIRPVQILVDYSLPTGPERLDWDTDEVRRMVGEIA